MYRFTAAQNLNVEYIAAPTWRLTFNLSVRVDSARDQQAGSMSASVPEAGSKVTWKAAKMMMT